MSTNSNKKENCRLAFRLALKFRSSVTHPISWALEFQDAGIWDTLKVYVVKTQALVKSLYPHNAFISTACQLSLVVAGFKLRHIQPPQSCQKTHTARRRKYTLLHVPTGAHVNNSERRTGGEKVAAEKYSRGVRVRNIHSKRASQYPVASLPSASNVALVCVKRPPGSEAKSCLLVSRPRMRRSYLSSGALQRRTATCPSLRSTR